jgi:hypothetical protein
MGKVKNNPTWQALQAGVPPQHKRQRGGMGRGALAKYMLLFLALALLLFTGWEGYLYINDNFTSSAPSPVMKPAVVGNTIHVFENEDRIVSRRPQVQYKRPDFETGIVFPQWKPDGYGANWQQQLPTIQTQSGARWMEMTIFLSQATNNSTQVRTNQSAPTPQSFASGIKAAREQGYHVFVVPLMGVDSPANQWAGTIQFSNYQDEAQWFDSYWKTYQPYVEAAAQNGADQLAIATEMVLLQQSAPAPLWNTLISRIHSVFPGTLTYDMDWSSLGQATPSWMSNSLLPMIGISEYLQLANDQTRVAPKEMPGLWKTIVKTALDNFSLKVGKPLIISEIGYRNTADALYHPWARYSTGSPPDPEEQAAACDAALINVIPDKHIVGIFFWGWDEVQGFKLSGQPAALAVLNKWYTSPQS